MQFRTKKQFIGTWSGSVAVACLALMLGFASTGYGDVILGNFESADSNDGWGGGSNDVNAILVPDSNVGVTLGLGSLQLTPVAAGAYWGIVWEGSPLDLTDANFQFDLTMVASEWGGSTWTKIADKVAINSDGPSGWKEFGPGVPDNNVTVINRDTGVPTDFDWGAWSGDVNKTYTANVSNYDATGATWMQVAISVQDANVLDTGHFYFDNMRLITPDMIVSKSKVTAGKTQYNDDGNYDDMKDALTVSGTAVLPTDVNDIEEVGVIITSLADGEVIYTETLSGFDPDVVNRTGKYKYTAKVTSGHAGKITSLALDFRKGTYSLAAKNVDLTGLACPFEVGITLGSYELSGNAYESAVNGTKTIPTRLMRMYKDTLIVTKAKAKNGTSALSDSLSVSGEIAVEDINDANLDEPDLAAQDVNIVWGSQTFTVPAGSFEPGKGHSYKCSKIVDPNGIVTAAIDFDKCTFTVSIAKANISAVHGDVAFGLLFGDFNEADSYTLP